MASVESLNGLMMSVDELRKTEGELSQATMMSRSRKFYTELQVFYPQDSWQRQATDMVINATDGTLRLIDYASQQLSVLLGKIAPADVGNVSDQLVVENGLVAGYGWSSTGFPPAPSSELAEAGKEPKDFTPVQRKSYLTKLSELTYVLHTKDGAQDIANSMVITDALLGLLIKYEDGGTDFSNEIRAVVGRLSKTTDHKLDVTVDSKLAKWLTPESITQTS